MRIFEFIHDRDGRVSLAAVAQPQAQFGSPLVVWEAVLKQEQGVTARIHVPMRWPGKRRITPPK